MNKINVYWLIKNHVASLKEDGANCLSRSDICLHFIFPLLASLLICIFFKVMPGSVVGIMVNFGSITTALLMSAVVMVYDQKSKIIDKKDKEIVEDKIKTYSKNIGLYRELCQNICFAILTSIIIVILAAILSFYDVKTTTSLYTGFFIAISFFCYALFISTMITFLMILKRFSIILDN
ncbi:MULTISPECIES: hypothetical protein [Enterobacter]|uniref:hypothetical protein n=1 Tax=Enterobacter TaxID=547 RepID=UPI0023ED3A82|nr:hypothetical protein [Enterobacter hormaechei]HCM9652323.1 hypothetical protein [Enterobacter kobei]HDS5354555.1 hypothetical protein [Enterobacter kobei]